MKKIILLLLTSISLTCFSQEREVFYIVENMPTFSGGDISAFKKYIELTLQYPADAVKDGISGRIYVSFVIESNGILGSTKIIRGINPILDSAAARAVRNSPLWIPGSQSGHTVPVTYTIPINFMLGTGKELPAGKSDIICTPGSPKSLATDTHVAITVETVNIVTEFYIWVSKPRSNSYRYNNSIVGDRVTVLVDTPDEYVCVVLNKDRYIETNSRYNAKKKTKTFNGFSSNEKITLVGFKIINNVAYFSRKATTPSKVPVKLDYRPIDLPGLKKELKEVGK